MVKYISPVLRFFFKDQYAERIENCLMDSMERRKYVDLKDNQRLTSYIFKDNMLEKLLGCQTHITDDWGIPIQSKTKPLKRRRDGRFFVDGSRGYFFLSGNWIKIYPDNDQKNFIFGKYGDVKIHDIKIPEVGCFVPTF